MNLSLLCVGKLKEPFYRDAAAEYAKRLSPYCRLSVTEISESRLPDAPSPAQLEAALSKEAAGLLSKIGGAPFTVGLCIEGTPLSSGDLAELLGSRMRSGAPGAVFVIGGSFGLHESVKRRADLRLSMSKMTFPHHLARVMLLEQLYRSFKIMEGSRYHK